MKLGTTALALGAALALALPVAHAQQKLKFAHVY